MKKPVEMTDDELVRAEFMRRFSTWNIPIERISTLLDRVPNEERQMHYQELNELINKDAFKREIADWKRRVAKTLAMGIHNDREISEVEKQGLRILMIEIENFEETLRKRAMLVIPPKPLRALHSKM